MKEWTVQSSVAAVGRPSRKLAWYSMATVVAGLALAASGQAAYVDRIAPIWTPVLGGVVALVCATVGQHRKATCVAATVLLLPSAIAGIFHVMRALGAIPLPVDWLALVVSLCAALTVWTAWKLSDPLRREDGLPLQTPRWVAAAGVLTALIYPVLKTMWLAGLDWLAPEDVGHEVDAAYVVPVTLALVGGTATVVALRWWDRPAPRWARNAAVAGGLVLTGLGVSGMNATFTTETADGPVLGVVVYGSWALWGLATLAVAGRLSSQRESDVQAPGLTPAAAPAGAPRQAGL
jgi:hypothetical protein